MHEATGLPPAAQDYLQQLAHESAVLPERDRQQLLGQIHEHLSEALEEDGRIEPALARLGHPRELVQAAGGEQPAAVPTPSMAPLWIALAVMALGVVGMVVGGLLLMSTGRGRSLIIIVPSLLLALAGIWLGARAVRSLRTSAAGARTAWTALQWVGRTTIAGGLMLLTIGLGMLAVTGRGRAMLLVALPGTLLLILGVVANRLAHRARTGGPAAD